MLKAQALVLVALHSNLALHINKRESRLSKDLTDKELIEEYHKQLLDGSTTDPLAQEMIYDQGSEKPDGRHAVLCLGDSITEGDLPFSASWVAAMSLKWPNLHFYNKGVNGDHAWNLVQRLPAASDALLQNKGKPTYVVIMIGTNNAMASLNEKAAQFMYQTFGAQEFMIPIIQNATNPLIRKMSMERRLRRGYPKFPKNANNLETLPTLTNYEAQLIKLVQRTKQLGAKVAVMSQIPLGEDFSDDMLPPSENGPFGQLDETPNSRTQRYVDVAKRVAGSQGVDYLPLNEMMRSIIKKANIDSSFSHHGKKASFTHFRFADMAKDHLQKRVCDRPAASLDSLTPPELTITHDFVHPNERGAAIIATTVHRWLTNVSRSN